MSLMLIMILEVIPISQTNPISPALLNLDGYIPHLNFDPSNENLVGSGMRGVAIFTKLSMTVRDVDLTTDDFKDHTWVEMMSTDAPILVGCIYRSPSCDITKESSMASAISTAQLIITACISDL